MSHILFAHSFLKAHPRAGQPTHFEAQILNGRKIHTIRKGNAWEVGDPFEPRRWSGAPYRSPQVALCEAKTVTAVYPLELCGAWWHLELPDNSVLCFNRESEMMALLAKNDGLSVEDFMAWFPEDFEGQIICWTGRPYDNLVDVHGRPDRSIDVYGRPATVV